MKIYKTNFDLKIDFLIEKSISRFKITGKNMKKIEKSMKHLEKDQHRPKTQIYRGFLLKPGDSY